jgi:hypothetical protein
MSEADDAPVPHVLHIADPTQTRELLCKEHHAVSTTNITYVEQFPESTLCPRFLAVYRRCKAAKTVGFGSHA